MFQDDKVSVSLTSATEVTINRIETETESAFTLTLKGKWRKWELDMRESAWTFDAPTHVGAVTVNITTTNTVTVALHIALGPITLTAQLHCGPTQNYGYTLTRLHQYLA